MAATGFTPISLYYTTTASATPSAGNLVAGELALNTTDEKLYFKNASGTVKLLASNAATTPVTPAGSNTQIQYNNSGSFGASSALTFDGTNFASTGNITSGGTLQALATVQSSSGADLSLNANGANRDVIVKVNGTEQARFVGSTGYLGIGTSSPSQKLTVDGNAVLTSSSADRFLNITAGNTYNGYIQFAEASVDNQWAIGFDGDGSNYANLQFRRRAWGSALTAMTLDSAGNLGLGVTPSTWGVGKAIEVNSVGNAVWSAGTRDIRLVCNVYYASGAFKYASTGTASMLTMEDDGAFRFSNAASGSTGGTITFSERARISAAGGFSVGTTADPGAGAIYATGNITAYYSDDRLKTRLGVIENALDKVDQLQGFYYEANETAQALGYKVKREVGVSAQSVQAVLPEIVSPAPIDQQYLTVDYERLVPLLIEAVKELTAKVKALEAK